MLFEIPKGVEILKEFHFDYASIYVRNDNIVQVNTGENTFYTIVETLEVHNKINELTNCEQKLILHVTGKYASVDADTRKFVASENGLRYVIAQAFVLHSMAQRMIANFFMKIDKPKKPTKFFDTQHEAEKWLNTFNK